MKGVFWVLLALLAVSVAANVWQCREMRAAKDGCYTDTVRVTDTVVVREPQVRESVVVRTEYRWLRRVDTVFAAMHGCGADTVRDTVLVEIPIVQKVYEDSDYTAWVSGYRPKLDSIRVYRHETIMRERSRRWGIGIQAGYGLTPKSLSPYIGLGIQYRLY